MKWSFTIARIFGIDLKVHITFFLIVLWGAVQFSAFGTGGAMFGAGVVLLLFTCVTLHEFGHALVAQALGIPVRQIILLPIGGLAQLVRNPSRGLHELLIAAAGPLVNVIILIPLILLLDLRELVQSIEGGRFLPAPSVQSALWMLTYSNVMLVAFNLIPAFPLDGGRMLRAVLWMFTSFAAATRVASAVGQLLAIAMAIFALTSGNLVLLLIAAFVFFGAGAETAEGRTRTVLATRRVGDAYNRHAMTLSPYDPISRVVHHILNSYQPDFAVLGGRELLGVVTREDVLRYLESGGPDTWVQVIMRPDVVRVQAHSTLDEVRQALSEAEQRIAAVYDGPVYLGLVSLDDIHEAFVILDYLGREQSSPGIAGPYAPPGR
mgnify:CR=1 FL=1